MRLPRMPEMKPVGLVCTPKSLAPVEPKKEKWWNGSRLRNFAEALWGRGGTNAYPTNRNGAYYFSCSGHGGYVVPAKVLSPLEREAIDKYEKPQKVRAFYDKATGKFLGLFNPFLAGTRHLKIPSRYEYEEIAEDVYVFEEDCDWAILEKFTNIRADVGSTMSQAEREADIERSFKEWQIDYPAEQKAKAEKETK